MTPAWLAAVFAECSGCAMDDERDRARLADAIIAKLTRLSPVFAACISSSARSHFKTRGITDDSGGLAKQIGANGATSIIMLLENS